MSLVEGLHFHEIALKSQAKSVCLSVYLFVCGLFNEAASTSYCSYIASIKCLLLLSRGFFLRLNGIWLLMLSVTQCSVRQAYVNT
jgi:hypothetical protein